MQFVLNPLELVLELSPIEQLELSLYLSQVLYDYVLMFHDDGDDIQYRRMLLVKNSLERSLFALSSIDRTSLILSKDT
jgi:hypothetical protein